jgi:hypothetical protein
MEKTLQKLNVNIHCEHCDKDVENVWNCKMDSIIGTRYALLCADCQKLIGIYSLRTFIERVETPIYENFEEAHLDYEFEN